MEHVFHNLMEEFVDKKDILYKNLTHSDIDGLKERISALEQSNT
jgi:hypothetical protein